MRIDLKSAAGGTLRGEFMRPAPKARAFSAKGATLNPSLGQRPGSGKPQASALKARLAAGDMHMPMNRTFSARAFGGHQFLGRCPRLEVR